ncbi:tryptophan synthase, alpha subunit [Campylobacter iguaniorum]|uniref:tryptophan synthase subunit alpha n=1 Tax=Campylobacter iguaniorum TaxID=1244531 RepID=UPI0007C93243|nr:tryptophan synthase subunit alpha [Campylobacter iguaniorum]ANE35404.1 tryptophan synthase, alpha subunit [Campylobacter iguaniorum]
MDKIANAFKNKANIGYIVAGYPSSDYTKEFLNSLDESVLDIVEIGIPYLDPLADGKLISMASFEACKNGITTDKVFEILKGVKTSKCLVFLVYYNLILAYGEDKFLQNARECGMSGIIVPDMPFDESEEFRAKCLKFNLALIPLVAPTSKDRTKDILKNASGFIYAVGSLGVTGGSQTSLNSLKDMIDGIKENTNLPVAIGFGIKTNEDVKRTKLYADGTIIGTKIVELTQKCNVKELNKEIEKLFV